MKSDLPIIHFVDQHEWLTWLEANHAVPDGLWLRIAKKGARLQSLTYAEALDCALCYGWIDGQKKALDEESWLQKFTPRRARSLWSKVNQEKVAGLIEAGLMKPAGLREVERAKGDGRWGAAYDSASRAQVPADLQVALDGSPKAGAFFATLNGANRYAILFRIQTAKKVETRAKRIKQFIEMLEQGELIHP